MPCCSRYAAVTSVVIVCKSVWVVRFYQALSLLDFYCLFFLRLIFFKSIIVVEAFDSLRCRVDSANCPLLGLAVVRAEAGSQHQ